MVPYTAAKNMAMIAFLRETVTTRTVTAAVAVRGLILRLYSLLTNSVVKGNGLR